MRSSAHKSRRTPVSSSVNTRFFLPLDAIIYFCAFSVLCSIAIWQVLVLNTGHEGVSFFQEPAQKSMSNTISRPHHFKTNQFATNKLHQLPFQERNPEKYLLKLPRPTTHVHDTIQKRIHMF
jgi:hypothetical protein